MTEIVHPSEMSKTTISIRRIEKKDFDTLYAIDQVCFSQGIAYTKWELKWFLSRKGAIGYVAEATVATQPAAEGTPIAGFIIAWLQPRKAGHIITLDVLQRYRRQSIGSVLMRAVEEDFRRESLRVAVLEVSVNNAAAQEFYKGFGFEITERLRYYYPTGEDAFEMVRWFEK